MFRKFILSLFALCCFALSFGAKPKVEQEKRIDKIEDEMSVYRRAIDSLEYGHTRVMERLESTDAMVDHQMSAISNILSVSNRSLTYFGFFLTVLGLVLGAYVTRTQNRVQKMSEQVAFMEGEITKKRDEINRIQDQINSDFDGFYRRIRRADTADLVKRLEDVPLDLANVIRSLSVRNLATEDFEVLKRAYRKLIELGKENTVIGFGAPTYGFGYRLLFFQHFPGKAISDDFLRIRIQQDFEHLVSCCFENDIKKSLSEIASVLHHTGVAFDRVSILRDLLVALRVSEFKGDAELFAILQNGIADEVLWETANKMADSIIKRA